jgi:hypothetical protein
VNLENAEEPGQGTRGREDVKKLICLSSRDFIFDPKCLPTPERSLIGHPRAIVFNAELAANLKINFFTSSGQEVHQSFRSTKRLALGFHPKPAS